MDKTEKVIFVVGSAIVFGVLLLLYFFLGFSRLDYTEYGLVFDGLSGQIQLDTVYTGGLHWIGPFAEFVTFPSFTQTRKREEFHVRSSDQLPLRVSIAIHYSFIKEMIPTVYEWVLQDYDSVVWDFMEESISYACLRHNATHFYSKKEEVRQDVFDQLSYDLAYLGITVEDFALFSFELPERVTKAIEEAEEAGKVLRKEEWVKERRIVESEQELVVAEKNAEILLVEAQAMRDALIMDAEATANMYRNVSLSRLEARHNVKNALGFDTSQLFKHLKHLIVREHQDDRVMMELPERFLKKESP
ncbi:hypothetical protein P9112_000376 [Eukaryota sp. TZLM1-RC]